MKKIYTINTSIYGREEDILIFKSKKIRIKKIDLEVKRNTNKKNFVVKTYEIEEPEGEVEYYTIETMLKEKEPENEKKIGYYKIVKIWTEKIWIKEINKYRYGDIMEYDEEVKPKPEEGGEIIEAYIDSNNDIYEDDEEAYKCNAPSLYLTF